ncbi:MAG: trigger factor [Candidatus Omnitrophica bacterium]|nr:trigger factor [Candidatus Omnitrophota bacterium]
MKLRHKHKDIEDSRREFSVNVSSEEIKEKLNIIYNELRGTVNIPGFRKGKIPRDILEKYHGAAAREMALSDLISDSYKIAAMESNAIPVGLPHISDVEFKEGQDLLYKATVDVRPKIGKMSFRNIRVRKKTAKVGDADIERYLTAFQESYAQFKSIEARPAKLGDYIVCDIECVADGKPMHEEQKNAWLLLDKEHSIPELVDGLIGASKEDKREIEATLPENTKEPKYSKRKVLFRVKINEIKEKILPDVNDDFVKGLGAYKSVEELREAAKKDLLRRQEDAARQDMQNQIFEQLLKDYQFQAPKGLVDEEAERIFKEIKEDLRKKGQDGDASKDDQLHKGAREEASKRVRLYFILDEIARMQNIDVTEKEVANTLNLLAQQSNRTNEKIREYYKDNNLLSALKNQLKENKITDFLLQNVDIKEINPAPARRGWVN